MADTIFLEAAAKIARDIEDRQGLGDEWDEIDNELQMEIMHEWAGLIETIVFKYRDTVRKLLPN